MPAPNSLYTCRYFALGSGCPNVVNGKNICSFAHWDTGRLASAFNQRGTCRYWLNGNCKNDRACYFEHRNTGVSGMYQGPLILDGFNLEVAIAAGNAGLDTFNHKALYDLIWAVKRIAFRASKGAIIDRPRPPKDPVYPDRFRPSGLGDNTKRKRPPPQDIPPQATPMKLESILKPQQTKRNFRYRNKKAPAPPKQAAVSRPTGYTTQGTQENPVEVLSDDDTRGVATKRQKLSTADCSTPKPSTDTPRAENVQSIPAKSKILIVRPDSVTQDTMQVDGHTYARTRHDYGSSDGHGPDERQLQALRIDLRKVKDVLQATVNNVKECNISMRNTFDNHSNTLGRPDIHSLLSPLGNNFEIVRVSSLEGIGYLDDILELLR